MKNKNIKFNNFVASELLNWEIPEEEILNSKEKVYKSNLNDLLFKTNHKFISKKHFIKDKKNLFKKNGHKSCFNIDLINDNKNYHYFYGNEKKHVNDKKRFSNLEKKGVFRENNSTVIYLDKSTKSIATILNEGTQYFYNEKILKARGSKIIIGDQLLKPYKKSSFDKVQKDVNINKERKIFKKHIKDELDRYLFNYVYEIEYELNIDYYEDSFESYYEDEFESYYENEFDFQDNLAINDFEYDTYFYDFYDFEYNTDIND